MTFNLTFIAIFVIGGYIYSLILPKTWRKWVLFITSVLTVYVLQSPLLVRHMDFILPTATLLLVTLVWALTASQISRRDIITIVVLMMIITGLALMRLLPSEWRIFTASRPPDPFTVFLVIMPILVFTLFIHRQITPKTQPFILSIAILFIVIAFIILKTESLANALSAWLRQQEGRDPSFANPLTDLNWLGFSYVAFRLIHILRDRQTGKLPDIGLRDMHTYIIFFSSLTAGPIDRIERFQGDLDALPDMNGRDPARIVEGTTRIVVGIFKKFVVADSLALFALNTTNIEHVTSAGGMWILLYGYAFRLFFDFSGYSDIAIGIGILFGIRLPENFNRPYLRNTITAFWQSWHITLSNWVRFYIFSPLTRTMLRWRRKPSSDVIALIGLMTTMIIIGLWHGISLTFFMWGVWHGMGLFVHKIWSDRTRKWYNQFKKKEGQLRLWNWAGIFLTFHFVVLGWVWFALPDVSMAFSVLGKLFGVGF
ncbi:MAG: hypothetical protein CUN52_05705 [Phototrophicales bacterium]|nr:MAG: hypothetical protein CUN52_05705 [Phototrophicales bacterium]